MSAREFSIQIYFENALYISANEEPELLRVIFNDKYIFVGLNNVPIQMGETGFRRLSQRHGKLILER